MTLARAIKIYVTTAGGATSKNITQEIINRYPNRWKTTAVQAHLYACAVNQPKAYVHHPTTEKFLYKTPEGIYEIYTDSIHGPNMWKPPEQIDESRLNF